MRKVYGIIQERHGLNPAAFWDEHLQLVLEDSSALLLNEQLDVRLLLLRHIVSLVRLCRAFNICRRDGSCHVWIPALPEKRCLQVNNV